MSDNGYKYISSLLKQKQQFKEDNFKLSKSIEQLKKENEELKEKLNDETYLDLQLYRVRMEKSMNRYRNENK